ASLENGAAALSAGGGGQLYGKLDVRVVSFAVGGDDRRNVGSETAPYRVTGERYVSTGLGLALSKPAMFAFESLDETWPSPIVVAMRGTGGARVVLAEHHRSPWRSADSVAAAMVDSLVPGGRRARWPV